MVSKRFFAILVTGLFVLSLAGFSSPDSVPNVYATVFSSSSTQDPTPSVSASVSSSTITLGQSVTITLTGTNSGASAVWQTLTLSLPSNIPASLISITGSDLSQQRVEPSGTPDWPGCYSGCLLTLNYPIAEGEDAPWPSGESHYLSVTVTPTVAGTFTYYYKTVAAASGNPNSPATNWDPASGVQDQQGENNYEGSITVLSSSTSVSVNCQPASPTINVATQCTASVTGQNPTGKVTFSSTSSTGTFSPQVYCNLPTSENSCSVSYTDSSVGSAEIVGSYQGNNPSGIGETSVSVGLPPVYTVTFSESGLSTSQLSNTQWSVTFNGYTRYSDSSSIEFTVPNGDYSYTVNTYSGYSATVNGGSITGTASVNGQNLPEDVVFTSSSASSSFSATMNMDVFLVYPGTSSSPNCVGCTNILYLQNEGSSSVTYSISFESCSFTPDGSILSQSCPPNWITASDPTDTDQPDVSASSIGVAMEQCPDTSYTCDTVSITVNQNLISQGQYLVNLVVTTNTGQQIPTQSLTVNVNVPTTFTTNPNLDVSTSIKQEPDGTYSLYMTMSSEITGNVAYIAFDDGQMSNLISNIETSLGSNFNLPSGDASNPKAYVTVVPNTLTLSQDYQLFSDFLTLGEKSGSVLSAIEGTIGPVEFVEGGIAGIAGAALLQAANVDGALTLAQVSSDESTILSTTGVQCFVNYDNSNIGSNQCSSVSSNPVPVYYQGSIYSPTYVFTQGQQLEILITGLTLKQDVTLGSSMSLSAQGDNAWYDGSLSASSCGSASAPGVSICTYPGTVSISGTLQKQCGLIFLGCSNNYLGTETISDPNSPFIEFSGAGMTFSDPAYYSSSSEALVNVTILSSGQSSYPLTITVPAMFDQTNSSDFSLLLDGLLLNTSIQYSQGVYNITANLPGGGGLLLILPPQHPEISLGCGQNTFFVDGGGFQPGANVSLSFYDGTSWQPLSNVSANAFGFLYYTTSIPSQFSGELEVAAFNPLSVASATCYVSSSIIPTPVFPLGSIIGVLTPLFALVAYFLSRQFRFVKRTQEKTRY